MSDFGAEIRAAFETQQSAFPPPPGLRAQLDAAVNAQARAAAPARRRADRNFDWLIVAAAALLTIAIVAGLMAAPRKNLSTVHPWPPSWTATGNMLTPRSGHTATLLPDGKVLVAGGIRGNRVLASAELYDPSTGRWTATGNMVTPRAFHTATLLFVGSNFDPRVLVAGGYDRVGGSAVASAELYDPSTGRWTATGNMVTPHFGHTATLVINGKVLVAGGVSGNRVTNSAELYDPSTATWTVTGNMAASRTFQTATMLLDGKVLVAGGADTTYDIVKGVRNKLATTEMYDPNTGSWAATGSMAAARTGNTSTLLTDGKVLVAGGGGVDSTKPSAELFDPSTGTWTATGNMAAASAFHTATLLPDGTVLVVGDSGAALIYDRTTGSWTAIASPVTGSDATATMLPDGTVLVAGGDVHGQGALAAAELYHPGTPVPLPPAGIIAPGTYFLANPDLVCAGGCSAYRRINFTLPAGWATNGRLVYKHLDQPGEVAFSAWTVDQVYANPCHWQGSVLSPLDITHVSTYDPATGKLIFAPYSGGLAHQALRGPLPRPLTQLTVAGWDGQAAYLTLALRIDLSVPATLDISKCDMGQFRSWTEWHVVGGANSHHASGQLDAVYMVDVDRRPLVIDASHMPATSAADLAELKAILASMIIDRS